MIKVKLKDVIEMLSAFDDEIELDNYYINVSREMVEIPATREDNYHKKRISGAKKHEIRFEFCSPNKIKIPSNLWMKLVDDKINEWDDYYEEKTNV